ncbi:hypothetical protein EJ110_NYTH53669 [Nymphaea thermarum]|nr:hypothetical protein EJ110_NYTH53669 [Nymphaea thermarum]
MDHNQNSTILSPNFLSQIISQKLNHTNYLTWKRQIVPFIKGHRFYGHLNGTTPAPPEWIMLEVKNAGGQVQETIAEVNPKYEMWMAHDQSHEIKNVSDQLAIIRHPVSDKDKVQQALSRLGSEFDVFCTALEVLPVFPSFEDLKAKLIQHEASRILRQELFTSGSHNVLVTGIHALQGSRPKVWNSQHRGATTQQFRKTKSQAIQNNGAIRLQMPISRDVIFQIQLILLQIKKLLHFLVSGMHRIVGVKEGISKLHPRG